MLVEIMEKMWDSKYTYKWGRSAYFVQERGNEYELEKNTSNASIEKL